MFAAGRVIIGEQFHPVIESPMNIETCLSHSLHHDRGNLLNCPGSKGISLWEVYFKHSSMQPLLDKYFGKASIVQIE